MNITKEQSAEIEGGDLEENNEVFPGFESVGLTEGTERKWTTSYRHIIRRVSDGQHFAYQFEQDEEGRHSEDLELVEVFPHSVEATLWSEREVLNSKPEKIHIDG